MDVLRLHRAHQSSIILCPNIFSIQCPGHGLISGAFDDGPRIGKEGDFVVVDGEAQQIIVVGGDVADWSQAGGYFCQVQPAGPRLASLDRVAPAQAGNLPPFYLVEKLKIALLASGAILAGAVTLELLKGIVPDIEMDNALVQIALADDELDGFGGADAGNGADQGADYAGRVAGGGGAGGGTSSKMQRRQAVWPGIMVWLMP